MTEHVPPDWDLQRDIDQAADMSAADHAFEPDPNSADECLYSPTGEWATTCYRPRQQHDPEPVEPTSAQLRMLGTLMTRNGISGKADRHAYCDRVIGHPIDSAKDLTLDEFQAVIEALQADLANLEAAAPAEPTQPEQPEESP
ncbi:MAG: hypothetical protein GEU74_12350 [Nitriliruptorales bacterium]|nr:hypothetical protein [Nitriliruptorales bacterium]